MRTWPSKHGLAGLCAKWQNQEHPNKYACTVRHIPARTPVHTKAGQLQRWQGGRNRGAFWVVLGLMVVYACGEHLFALGQLLSKDGPWSYGGTRGVHVSEIIIVKIMVVLGLIGSICMWSAPA